MKRFTKIISVILCLGIGFSLVACGGDDGKKGKTTAQKAYDYADLVHEKYWVEFDGDNYYLENYPTKSGEASRGYLWSYFAGLGMQYRVVSLDKTNAVQLSRYKTLLDGLKYYKSADSTDTVVKYHSGRGVYPGRGTGDVFFDDNIWVARNLLCAYEIFGEKEYLDEAKRVTNFIYTGWNDEIGGLVWNERGLTSSGTEQELERGLSANACSIIVNAWLYQITNEQSYLTWANKFYTFCKRVQDPETFMYYNGIHTKLQGGKRLDGEVNKALYSYNPGSMILADLIMYDITEDEAYLTDANRAATASYEAFKMTDLGSDVTYYKDFVWFSAILMESFLELKEYNKELVTPYIEVFNSSINYAYENYRNEEGFLPHNYAAGFLKESPNTSTVDDRSLLTQSGTGEIFALLAASEKI